MLESIWVQQYSNSLLEITKATEDTKSSNNPAIPFLDLYAKKGTHVHQKTVAMFMMALFVIAPNGECQMSVTVE